MSIVYFPADYFKKTFPGTQHIPFNMSGKIYIRSSLNYRFKKKLIWLTLFCFSFIWKLYLCINVLEFLCLLDLIISSLILLNSFIYTQAHYLLCFHFIFHMSYCAIHRGCSSLSIFFNFISCRSFSSIYFKILLALQFSTFQKLFHLISPNFVNSALGASFSQNSFLLLNLQ